MDTGDVGGGAGCEVLDLLEETLEEGPHLALAVAEHHVVGLQLEVLGDAQVGLHRPTALGTNGLPKLNRWSGKNQSTCCATRRYQVGDVLHAEGHRRLLLHRDRPQSLHCTT